MRLASTSCSSLRLAVADDDSGSVRDDEDDLTVSLLSPPLLLLDGLLSLQHPPGRPQDPDGDDPQPPLESSVRSNPECSLE